MSNTLTKILIHIVFGTKDRLALIPKHRAQELYSYLASIIGKQDCTAHEIGGMPDHVHLLVGLASTTSLADLMQHVKGSSSRWANDNWDEPNPLYWQRGYGAFSVSESQKSAVRAYIQNQEAHHRTSSFSHEWATLLNRHGLTEP